MDGQKVIAELRRVAELLRTSQLTQQQFKQHGRFSLGSVRDRFGTWNEAVAAAGLDPIPSGPQLLPGTRLTDEELLQEIIRLTREFGKKPTISQMSAKGKFSDRPYRKRWGTFGKACEVAYAQYGYPEASNRNGSSEPIIVEPIAAVAPRALPQIHQAAEAQRRKKVQFGEPIDFRGLRFAPINEQGVVYLFGMLSHELGFLIESVRTEYPDCEGKRCVDAKRQRWEHVFIEFEYQSKHFLEHGHAQERCDLIVCWIHNWPDCPIDVLELKSQIKYLPNRPLSVQPGKIVSL